MWYNLQYVTDMLIFLLPSRKTEFFFLCYDLQLRAMCPHPGDQAECTSVSLSAATGIWPNGCGGDPGSSTGPVCGWRKTPDTGAGNAPLFSPASSDPAGLWPPPGYSSMSHRPPSKGTVVSEIAKKKQVKPTLRDLCDSRLLRNMAQNTGSGESVLAHPVEQRGPHLSNCLLWSPQSLKTT